MMPQYLDRVWVDEALTGPLAGLWVTPRRLWRLLTPTHHFYSLLESGDEDDLRSAAAEIGEHVGLHVIPRVGYEWALKMRPDVGGEISIQGPMPSMVRIPLSFAGKPLALGAILAHELSHQALALGGLIEPDAEDLEPTTDLLSIALGLGKLVLNGTVADEPDGATDKTVLGYLSPELKVYAYGRINAIHSVLDCELQEGLSEQALQLLHLYPH